MILSGTLVTLSDGRSKPIVYVEEGDEVVSCLRHVCKVTKTMSRHVDEEIYCIRLTDGTFLKVTGEHPINIGLGFVLAKNLKVGLKINRYFQFKKEPLIKIDGNWMKYPGFCDLTIESMTKEHYSGVVHNLEVADDNSYIANNIGVHNCFNLGNEMLEKMS